MKNKNVKKETIISKIGISNIISALVILIVFCELHFSSLKVLRTFRVSIIMIVLISLTIIINLIFSSKLNSKFSKMTNVLLSVILLFCYAQTFLNLSTCLIMRSNFFGEHYCTHLTKQASIINCKKIDNEYSNCLNDYYDIEYKCKTDRISIFAEEE